MTAEDDLVEWARVYRDRDRRVRRALAEGISKHRVHTITGISRATIDRLLTRETDMTTTTEYGYWADHSKVNRDLRGDVLDFLGDQDAGFDVDALCEAYEDAINQALPDDIALRGYNFYGPYPRRDGSFEEIEAAIEAVDLSELAAKFDRDATATPDTVTKLRQ